MEMLYLAIALFLLLFLMAGLRSVLRGPTSADRMLTTQLFGTTAVACVLLLVQAFNYQPLRDVAFILLKNIPGVLNNHCTIEKIFQYVIIPEC